MLALAPVALLLVLQRTVSAASSTTCVGLQYMHARTVTQASMRSGAEPARDTARPLQAQVTAPAWALGALSLSHTHGVLGAARTADVVGAQSRCRGHRTVVTAYATTPSQILKEHTRQREQSEREREDKRHISKHVSLLVHALLTEASCRVRRL